MIRRNISSNLYKIKSPKQVYHHFGLEIQPGFKAYLNRASLEHSYCILENDGAEGMCCGRDDTL